MGEHDKPKPDAVKQGISNFSDIVRSATNVRVGGSHDLHPTLSYSEILDAKEIPLYKVGDGIPCDRKPKAEVGKPREIRKRVPNADRVNGMRSDARIAAMFYGHGKWKRWTVKGSELPGFSRTDSVVDQGIEPQKDYYCYSHMERNQQEADALVAAGVLEKAKAMFKDQDLQLMVIKVPSSGLRWQFVFAVPKNEMSFDEFSETLHRMKQYYAQDAAISGPTP